jgi:hypothetical protein
MWASPWGSLHHGSWLFRVREEARERKKDTEREKAPGGSHMVFVNSGDIPSLFLQSIH